MDNKELFVNLIKDIKREGIEDLLAWLESSTFYTDPASASYHSNYPRGLLDHSIMVYKILRALCKINKINVSEDTIKIVSLFHDLVKVGSYDISLKNIKNERTNNKWQSVMYYQNKDNNQVLSHGLTSAYLLTKYIELTEEEFTAICYHMGPWSVCEGEDKVYKRAIAKYPIVLLLHHADSEASFIHEPQFDILDIPWLENNLE